MYKFIYILPIPTEFEEFAFSIIASAFDYWEIWLYNHETKDTEIGDSKLFLLKKNIKVWVGIAMMIIYFNITLYTIQCIRTDNGSTHLPSAGICPKEKACVEEVSAFLWPLLHFLWYMDVTPGRQAPLPHTARERFAISFSVSKTYPRKTTRHPPELRTNSCCLFWWVLYFIVNVKFFQWKKSTMKSWKSTV